VIECDLARLIRSERLSVGDELFHPAGQYRGADIVATIAGDGLEVNGKAYPSPSTAARAAVGYSANGWMFWRLRSTCELLVLFHVIAEPRLLRYQGYRVMSRREAARLVPLLEQAGRRMHLSRLPEVLMIDGLRNMAAQTRHLLVVVVGMVIIAIGNLRPPASGLVDLADRFGDQCMPDRSPRRRS
jgi:hypothetical protein